MVIKSRSESVNRHTEMVFQAFLLLILKNRDVADTLDVLATSNSVFWDRSQGDGFPFYLTLKKSLDL